jgi:DNA-binding CsgD family transcriptional regulator
MKGGGATVREHRREPTAVANLVPPVLEREDELAALERAVDALGTGTGSLIVIEGEAGIGKTTLVRAAGEAARRAGIPVLRAVGSELEQATGFGVLRSLVTDIRRMNLEVDPFEGPAERARSVIHPEARDATAAPPDRADTFHALFWLFVNLTDRAPLAIVVDDAHWADEISAEFLAYLTSRLEHLRVLLVVALRPAAGLPALDALRASGSAVRLSPAPLTIDAVSVLARHAGVGSIEASRRDALWTDTGGNPFYLVELLRSGVPGADAIGEAGLPSAIRHAIQQRIGADTTDSRRSAEAVAILGESATVELVAAVAEVEVRTVVAVVRRLTTEGILDHARLAFSHPIVRSSVYDAIPGPIRERLHHVAATVLRDAGADSTAIAVQLLRTDGRGEARAVEALRSAGRAALAQGDPASARRYLERAMAEPVPDELLGSVHLELAGTLAAVGAPEADGHYEQGLNLIDLPHERAQARLAQGHALIATGRWQSAAAVFERGLADATGRDIELRSRLEAGFVSSALVGLVDRDRAAERLARILASPLTDPAHRELAAWTAFQHSVTVSASASESVALARRAIAGVPLETLVRDSQVVELAAGAFLAAGELEEEVAMLDAAIGAAQRIGAFGKAAVYSYCRSMPHFLSGRIADAIADAQAAVAAHDQGWEAFYPGSCASLAQALLELRDLDGAERAVALDDDRWRQRLDFQFMVPIARSRVRMARGDYEGAVQELAHAKQAGEQLGIATPSILADWRTWYAVALARAGRRDEAAQVADEAIVLADRWGAPIARARALWAAGMVAGSGGIEQLCEARTVAAGTSAALIETGLRVDLGAALRRAGRTVDAREELTRAADLAHRLGARALLDRARDELSAAGTRLRRYAVRGMESLTPSELRVARLAAEGRTNREVAQSLFVTPKAVEYHLANAYRKLQIAGRAELKAALRDDASREVASV